MKNVWILVFACTLSGVATAFAAAPGAPGSQAAPAGSVSASAPAPANPPITGAPTATIPVFEGRDPEKIADDDTIITQVIPLQFLSGPAVRDILTTVVNPDINIAAMNSAIVVTESSAVVKRIVQIICYVDVKPGGENVIGIVQLRAGNAAEAARQVNAVMGSQGR